MDETATRRRRGPAVVADERSTTARWADWEARTRQTPLTAIERDEGAPTLFVSNELVLNPSEQDLAQELAGRYGGRIVPPTLIPDPPPGLGPSADFPAPEERPLPIRLRFDDVPPVERPADTIGELLFDREPNRLLTFTSSAGMAIASLAARYAAQGRRISLNVVGSPAALALKNATEGTGTGPFQWPAFSGKSRIVHAWQLLESVRAVRSPKLVWIAVLDGGFWLDGSGVPLGPDFGAGVPQVNLIESKPAGGASPFNCGDDSCDWHGNAVASAAAAAVDNKAGAAGSGGTVALPVFFKTDLSRAQIYTCLHYCVAWGIDILNMSFSLKGWELDFDLSDWEEEFQWAANHGLIMVAAAGNDGSELPTLKVRPATRTPGVITVGWLNGDNAANKSNYGSSVHIWAPGSDIPVGPDGNNPTGSSASGTSLASPIVAGVAAMMRAVNPSLDGAAVRQILMETGWPGTGRVTRGLDASAAVLRSLGDKLPPDLREPNNTASSAASLLKAPSGVLTTTSNGLATRSHDADWWQFDLGVYSAVTITLDWYSLIGNLVLHLEADDALNDAADAMTRTSPEAGKSVLQGLLPPGTYRMRITGNGHTAYELVVQTKKAAVPADSFEPNDSFESATWMVFEPQDSVFGPVSVAGLAWGPGTFEATLHQTSSLWTDLTGKVPVNSDYYQFDVPAANVTNTPTISIKAEMPLDLTLYDAARNVIGSWSNVKGQAITPPYSALCYLRVSGKTTNRYWISVNRLADPTKVPDLWEQAIVFPDWWDNTPLYLFDEAQLYTFEVGPDRERSDWIVFQKPKEAIQVQVLDAAGGAIREGSLTSNGKVVVSTGGLSPGSYFVRVARLDRSRLTTPVKLRLVPPGNLAGAVS